MIYFTADLHLGHKNILAYCNRPWPTIEEHDEAILQNWRDTVKDGDLVYVLGDVVMGSIKKYADRINALPGKKVLIPGNHDSVWVGHEAMSGKDYRRFRDAGFSGIVQENTIWNANFLGWDSNEEVVLSHFPSEGESVNGRPDRFAGFRPVGDGRIILCGHIHDQWTWSGKNINVGVDAWEYKPVSAETLKTIVDMAKEGTD